MKTESELKDWFWSLFNNCYPVKHDDYDSVIYLYYDERFIRQKKLSRIIGEEIIYPKKPSGKCLFELNWENKYLWIDYNFIWVKLGRNYQEIDENIKALLVEHDKMCVLTPNFTTANNIFQLVEYDKMSVLTPTRYGINPDVLLDNQKKLKVLKNENRKNENCIYICDK